MEKVHQYLYAKPRLTGVVILIAGVISAIHLVSVYKSGDSFFRSEVLYTPTFLLLGLACIVEPRLLTTWNPEQQPAPAPVFKAFSIAVIVVAGLIGFYLRFVVFKAWKPDWQ